MAATTQFSSHFTDASTPAKGRPKSLHAGRGSGHDTVTFLIPTTAVDLAGDRTLLLALPLGARVNMIAFEVGDLDTNATETLDADLVLSNGTAADDVIIYNAGTGLEDAKALTLLHVDTTVASGDRQFLSIDLYVNTVSATPAAATLKLTAWWDANSP